MTGYDHTLIRASAGTGKTFQLSNRYLGLLAAGAPPDQILATTFTRKAAGEILDRVVLRLAEAAGSTAKCSELGNHLSWPGLSRSQVLGMLRALVRSLHRLQICTLDSFFAQVAGSFCLELGLPPAWRIIEEVTDQSLRSEAIELALRSDATHDVTRLIHLMAKGEASRSVSELLRGTVSSLYTLFLETDRRAWECIPRPPKLGRQQLAAACEALADAPLPADRRFEKARAKDLEAARANDWELFLGNGLAARVLAGESQYYRKEIPAETVDVYEQLLKHARAVLLDQMATQTEATYELLQRFHGHYQRLKHEAGTLRFEDVTQSLVGQEALRDVDQQHFRLDTHLLHLLLDEFQDTSILQWQVLQPLARHVIRAAVDPAASRAGPPSSFFCVGDTKQAIYGWRGGRAEILEALHGPFPSLSEQLLDKSYRSSPAVIEAVNLAFTRMARHPHLEQLEPAVRQWCDRFQHHTTARQALPGYVQLGTSPLADKEKQEQQEEVTLGWAADRIGQLVQQAPASDVGVLVRRNDTVARLIYELRSRGIPASEEGGHPLTDSSAVQAVLSLLKLVDHPGDTVACFHVARSPLGPLVELVDDLDQRQVLAVASRLRHALLSNGYGPTLLHLAHQLRPCCDRRDTSRLQQLVELGFAYREIETLRTVDFLRYVESTGMADPTTAEVRVMTIHQSKGLQFDIVVLPELDWQLVGQPPACVVGQPSPLESVDRVCVYRNKHIQQLLPASLRSLFDDMTRQFVQEALCVLYVAMTRAVHALHMVIRPSQAAERKLPKSAAGLLRAALTDGGTAPPSTVLYETGAPEWYRQRPRPPRPEHAADEPSAEEADAELPGKIVLAPPAPDSPMVAQSPSQLEGGGRVAASRLLDLQTGIATNRGTLFHAWFEQIHWLEDGAPDEQTLSRIAQQHDCAELPLQPQLDAFRAMLQHPAIAAVLRRASYQYPNGRMLSDLGLASAPPADFHAEVHNEQRMVVRHDGQLLTGFMDRLVLLFAGERPVAADIIDYKTDSVTADDPHHVKKLVEHYRPQIEAYRAAAARMFQLDPRHVVGRLLFVSAGVLQTVTEPEPVRSEKMTQGRLW